MHCIQLQSNTAVDELLMRPQKCKQTCLSGGLVENKQRDYARRNEKQEIANTLAASDGYLVFKSCLYTEMAGPKNHQKSTWQGPGMDVLFLLLLYIIYNMKKQ